MQLSIVKNVHLVEPQDFEAADHWYPRALNSNIHPLVGYFLNLSHEQLAERFCRINPQADPQAIRNILSYQPTFFRWAGSDLMHVTNSRGHRHLTVIETNSCPSGQKSMPLLDLNAEQGGYRILIEKTFRPMVEKVTEDGVLAVVFDKNPMENIGYAATVAEVFNEEVYLAQYNNGDGNPPIKFVDQKMYVNTGHQQWTPVRAAFRYVTQEPWNRIPRNSRTLLLNPIEACLAGGRNKDVASVAYEKFNRKFNDKGLQIITPLTYRKVNIDQLHDLYQQMGGNMVIKVPDSNAGQGVITVTNDKELLKAVKQLTDRAADNLLVQQLINCNPGNLNNQISTNSWYHVGTLPDSKGRSFAFDVRFMIHATEEGLRPLAAYSRRARVPLNKPFPEDMDSWEVYGTNLSVKNNDGWTYDDERLVLFDVRNFGLLGLGIDELIKGFFQTCMSVYAIDQHAISIFKDETEVLEFANPV
jgi:hypothetical protein